MSKYASKTTVTENRSISEIEALIFRASSGSDPEFMYAKNRKYIMVQFKLKGKLIRFVVNFPDLSEFAYTDTGRERVEGAQHKEWAQACRQRMRSLLATIKGKLISVDDGVEVFEEAFMANIVLPDNSTFGSKVLPRVEQICQTGKVPALTLMPG